VYVKSYLVIFMAKTLNEIDAEILRKVNNILASMAQLGLVVEQAHNEGKLGEAYYAKIVGLKKEVGDEIAAIHDQL